jgi:broad-specificity NMP kinase
LQLTARSVGQTKKIKHMAARSILVVVGASGVGKTTAVLALQARGLPQVRCFHFDSIGVPSPDTMEREFGGGERWQAHATDQWILRLSQERSSSSVDVLDGQTRPSYVRAAVARFPQVTARIVLLDCVPSVRRARLASRGQPELANPQMEAWAAYLRGQADALQLPIIDTSQLSVEAVVDALEVHVEGLRTGS